MKQLIVGALLVTAVLAERDYDAMFAEFKAHHLKAYADGAEESTRKKNFVENMRKAEVLQAANPLAEFGVNRFADMSAAEFKAHHNGERYYRKALLQQQQAAVVDMPFEAQRAAAGQKVDWREKGVVAPIKNQGGCGSCWAFSAIGNIESMWAIAGNTLTTLSEQELVSCDQGYGDEGCDGGLMNSAFEWLIEQRKGQVATEASYPYTSGVSGMDGTCKSNLDALPVGAVVTGYNQLARSEDTMAAFVLQRGPCAVAVDASSFQSYRSGIMTNCISRQINHGVIVVGYDDTNVPPYWIVRNSWGTSWGESGYIRIAKGSNQCLISQYVTSAVVASNLTKH